MSKAAAAVIKRLAEHAESSWLDEATRQLLLEARAQLIRVAPDLRALGEEFSDSAWMPDASTADVVIEAALAHAENAGITAFCLAVPGTSPRLGVAMAEYGHLIRTMGSEIGLGVELPK